MTQRDNILQELKELQSLLVNASAQNIYRVPAGYFESLADQVLRRIRALEVDNAAEELGHLSPLLNGISKKMPYAVPLGYFENLAEASVDPFKTDDENAAEELATLSPLLSGLKKEMPYSVPQAYFQNLAAAKNTEVGKPQAKVISITKQKWFRYAAAAMVIGFVAIAGFLLINRNGAGGNYNPEAIVKGVIKNVSTEELDQFVKTIDEGAPIIAKTGTQESNEIKEFIKDIPDEEIQKFLEETQTNVADETSDNIFMN